MIFFRTLSKIALAAFVLFFPLTLSHQQAANGIISIFPGLPSRPTFTRHTEPTLLLLLKWQPGMPPICAAQA